MLPISSFISFQSFYLHRRFGIFYIHILKIILLLIKVISRISGGLLILNWKLLLWLNVFFCHNLYFLLVFICLIILGLNHNILLILLHLLWILLLTIIAEEIIISLVWWVIDVLLYFICVWFLTIIVGILLNLSIIVVVFMRWFLGIVVIVLLKIGITVILVVICIVFLINKIIILPLTWLNHLNVIYM